MSLMNDFKCCNCGYIEKDVCYRDQDDAPKHCPKCFGHLEKKVPKVAVHFKGPGWTPTYHGGK